MGARDDLQENVMGETRGLVELINKINVKSEEKKAQDLHRTSNTHINEETPFSELSASDLCGFYNDTERGGHIVGGEKVAQLGLFPWQLSLASGYSGFAYYHICGASLLTR